MKAVFLCVALMAASLSAENKKIVAYSWDLGDASAELLLENADKFAQVGIDGVAISVPGARNILAEKSFGADGFSKKAETIRKLVEKDGFRESGLKFNWTPRPRLSWNDDAAWANASSNMAALARLAKAAGVGLLIGDHEDYSKTKQFEWLISDGEFSSAAALARKRGAEIVAAMAREKDDLNLLFFWFLSFSCRNFVEVENPRAVAESFGDLWPAFIDGMLDAAPPRMRFHDGNEYTYRAKAENKDFYLAFWRQRSMEERMVSPENRVKWRANVRVSSGHYLDAYTATNGNSWYIGPVNGSRLLHLEENLRQALNCADEYVWIFGEQHTFVDWQGNKPRWKGVDTWDRALPGFNETLLRLRDPHKWAAQKTGVSVRVKRGNWQGARKRQGVFKILDDETLEMRGVEEGCWTFDVPNLAPGEWLRISFEAKGTRPTGKVHWKKDGKWEWSLPMYAAAFDRPCSDKDWRVASFLARVPVGADECSLLLGSKQQPEDLTLFRRVLIERLR